MIEEILTELNLSPERVLKKPYRDYLGITAEMLVLSIVETTGLQQAAEYLGYNSHTSIREVLKQLPIYKSKPYQGARWDLFLLSLIEYKKCSKCGEILHNSKFFKDNRALIGYKSSCRLCNHEYKQSISAKIAEYGKEYRSINKERIATVSKEYKINNRDKSRLHSANRRARLLNAMPFWADLDKIREIYSKCPEGMHVDHIIPLCNAIVSGLHVENNLQYLSIHDNLVKSNTFIPE